MVVRGGPVEDLEEVATAACESLQVGGGVAGFVAPGDGRAFEAWRASNCSLVDAWRAARSLVRCAICGDCTLIVF